METGLYLNLNLIFKILYCGFYLILPWFLEAFSFSLFLKKGNKAIKETVHIKDLVVFFCMKFKLLIAIIIAFLSFNYVNANEGDADVSFYTGTFDIIDEGKTEDEIYSFMSDKYGDWIVFKPQFNTQNFLLWILPYIALIFGGFFIFSFLKKRQ